MFAYVRRIMKKRKHQKESLNARLQMEKDAQDRTEARLKAVEISMMNQTRQRRSMGSSNG